MIDQLVDRLGIRGKIQQEVAVLLWPKVVGPDIARRTTGVTVKSGIMYVTMTNSAWAHQLSFLKQDLLKAINARLGGNVIRDMRFGAGHPRGGSWRSWGVPDLESQAEVAPGGKVEQVDMEFAAEVTREIPDKTLGTLLQRVIISGRKWRCRLDQSGKQIR